MRFVSALALLSFLVSCGRTETKDTAPGDPVDSPTDSTPPDTDAFLDKDGDSYGEAEDCDDHNDAIHPGAEEACDGVDNDCDGLVDDADETVSGQSTWHQDLDGDGYGNAEMSQVACEAPSGFVADNTDCDDLSALFHPGAEESDCTDERDLNCDGSVGYADADGDGFAACEECDDAVASNNPVALEICDGADNDCDGELDESDAVDVGTWYADTDADGYGDAASPTEACDMPSGHVADDTDCDDTSPDVHPDAVEVCDTVDNDCDGWVDDTDPDVTGTTTFFVDADGDGHGGSSLQVDACEAPGGYVTSSDDCNDLDAATFPGAAETCDLADNDCDGATDEGVGSTWYADSDGDGYGNGSVSQESCDAPSGYVGNSLDCDDFSATTSPASYEVCDGVDNDCDGSADEDAINAVTFYEDQDGDGYGVVSSSTSACTAPSGYAATSGDCNDADNAIHPSASEVCDTVDNDCDGATDEDAVDAATWYRDADNDGYGDTSDTSTTCDTPTGYVGDATDCDDTAAGVYPGASETCDGVDNDCDGTSDEDTEGTAISCPADHCSAILAADATAPSGNYWIDPAGSGAFEAYCDMTTSGGGWTLALNLDTSDGHVMWWANDLWTDANTYGDVSTPFSGDHKSQAFMDLSDGARLLLVVHEDGAVVGWKSFDKSGAGSLSTLMAGGDNTLISSAVADSDTGNIWSNERLVRSSTDLYANRCIHTGGGTCVNDSGSSPDGDRIGSSVGTPSDNNGGGLGNWHDMGYCCSGQTYAGRSCNGDAFRTTSEAQAGWTYSSQYGAFGSDSFGATTGTQNNTNCGDANWSSANGVDYDYAIYLGQ